MKETLAYEGIAEAACGSPRQVLTAAYSVYDFLDKQIWLEMLQTRNEVPHTYDGDAARRLAHRVAKRYVPAFVKLEENSEELYADTLFADPQTA